MSEKDIIKMTLEELKAEYIKIKDSDDHTRKIEICTQIIELDPKDAKAFCNRGVAYDNLSEYQKAIKDYDQAIALKPQYAEAFYNRGVAYNSLGEYQKAIEDYDQAIVLKSQYAEAFNNRGVAYRHLGEYQKAIEDYDQAIALNPQYAWAFNNRGVAYCRLGEYQKAIQDHDQAIDLNSKDAQAFYSRGVAYRKLGKKEKAIEDFKKAQELDPSIIANEQIKTVEKKIEKTQASNQEVQGFQGILEELGDKHQEEEDNWFKWSKRAIGITLSLIVLVIILIAYGAFKSSDIYIIYVFSSVVTLAIIRQYTNAKSLRIEASNRVAMAKMFERVRNENSAYQQEFLPKLTDAIVYSTTQTKNNTDGLIEKITNILEKLKK